MATWHRQLVTEQGDLDILLVGRRLEPNQVKQPANEQEGDRAAQPTIVARAQNSSQRPNPRFAPSPSRMALLMDVADMDVIMGAIRRKEMADAMEHDGVPGETLVMLVEERPLSGLGHRAASALGVLALVSETRATSTTGLSCARFVPDCLEPVARALAVSQFLPCGRTHDAAERGQCRERPTPGRRAGWTCRARFSTGSVLKVWPSWFSRMDAGDDLTFAISVDGRGRESWRWGCRLHELLDERCSWS